MDESTATTLAHAFLRAFDEGQVCLHPTDTLPGLTFNPLSMQARDALALLKRRPESKPCLGLVANSERAKAFFAPLPGAWHAALAKLWPGSLSVVWKASSAAPATMVASDGTIGLRVPQLADAAAWFRIVLDAAKVPLPTTSVNESGQPPAIIFAEARERLLGASVHIPNWSDDHQGSSMPSTVIQLQVDGSFKVLRLGAVRVDMINAALQVND